MILIDVRGRMNATIWERGISLENQTRVIEYKCPCCNAGLTFDGQAQQLKCAYCDNTFDLETVKAFNEATEAKDTEEFQWETVEHNEWSEAEQQAMKVFTCPSCGGEILCDETTAATFCPYCDNPTVMPGRLSGGMKPDAVIPFKTGKEDAKAAFLNLCKGKTLLPKSFTSEQHLEKITGVYVPFWLYDCSGSTKRTYKATRVRCWSDSNYNYQKTDHYLLQRNAEASFVGIPMDGSRKMDDTFMESIEPYDYKELVDFDTGYLTGFLADKYDVPSEEGKSRIQQRVDVAMEEKIQPSLAGYSVTIPLSKQVKIDHSKARYVLLPVWMLNTQYRGKLYTFAMNGQTGKMTGKLPICPARFGAWFASIAAVTCALMTLIRWIV